MKRKRAMLVINPISGTRSKAGLRQAVESKLGAAGIETTTLFTQKVDDAAAFSKKAVDENFDIVISAGGDGTVNQIANVLSHTPVTLGILPFGSGNGFARSLGIPQDSQEALKIILAGFSITCDRGLVDNHPFYCTFGTGLDAAVSKKFAQMKKRGRATYLRSLFREFLKYKSQPYAISLDGKVITEKAIIVAVCNARQYGNNAYIAPKANLTDGLLDVTVVHSGNPLETVMMGMELMTGNIDRNTRIETFKVKETIITRLSDGPVHIDGEPLIMGKRLKISCDPMALKVFAPEKETSFKPIVSPLRAMIEDVKYDVMARLRTLG